MANLAAAFDVLTTGADKAASDIERVGNASEHTGGKVSKLGGSARLLGSTFVGASNQALGPLQEIADKFEIIERASEQATSKAGGRLLGLGAAGLGAGAFLSTLASREQGAEQQLRAAIEQTGHSYENFADQIDKATVGGERFGAQASTTLDALNRLTLTTHNPTEALKDLAVAQDVAAVKHISLAKAAEVVGLVFNGSTRAGKQFGLQLENTAGAAKALVTAQTASKAAIDHVTTAQQTYNDRLAVYNQTVKPTLAQQIGLFRAHQNVAKAQDEAAKAAARLKTAQQKANDATTSGTKNVQKLADVTKGQAAGAADTFAGHLRALGAHIEDTAGKFGKDYGGAISTASLVTIGFGTLIETGLVGKLGGLVTGLGRTGKAFIGLRDVQVASSAEGAAAVEAGALAETTALEGAAAASVTASTTMRGAMVGLLGPIGLVVGALAALKESYDLIKGSKAEGAAFATAENQIGDALKAGAITKAQANDLIKQALLHPDQSLNLPTYLPASGTIGPDTSETAFLGQKPGRNSVAANAAAAAAGGKKVGKAAGDATLQAFLDSIGGGKAANAVVAQAAAEAAKAAKQAAIDTATAMRDAVKANFDQAKTVLRDVLAQSLQLRQSISASLVQGAQITDVFGTGPNLNANHAFGKGQDFNSVKRFFEDRLVKLRRFAAELSALVHKGLDPAVVAQIAQAGVDQGGRLADALSGASKGQLGEVNSLNRQVTQIADSAGKRVADVQFKAQIAADKKNTEALARRLDLANRHLAAISGKKISSVDQAAQAFLLRA